jgi:hypothetical protein
MKKLSILFLLIFCLFGCQQFNPIPASPSADVVLIKWHTWFSESGHVYMTGTLWNQGEGVAVNVRISITAYDIHDEILDIAISEISEIQPDSLADFKAVFYDIRYYQNIDRWDYEITWDD